jgi:hypothetical protein
VLSVDSQPGIADQLGLTGEFDGEGVLGPGFLAGGFGHCGERGCELVAASGLEAEMLVATGVP